MSTTRARAKWLLLLLSFLGAAFGPGAVQADNGPQHRVRQPRPIWLGTSGGNILDQSKRYCCGGTLGALVFDVDGYYVLSCNHILARVNQAEPIEAIIQPGLIDRTPACSADLNDAVAYLSASVPIQFKARKAVPLNEVDAAMAEVMPGAVQMDGSILDIGPISASAVSAYVSQGVRKSGRTTGQTYGTVAAVDVTVNDGYSKTCGGPANQVARFVHQIRITPGSFSAGGDSGSLVVENVASTPRAVGLLFAGSPTSTLANPIDRVLASLGVALVGGTGPAGATEAVQAVERLAALKRAGDVKLRHEAKLLEIDGVVGTGLGLSETAEPLIEVYLDKERSLARSRIKQTLESICALENVRSVPARVVVTGQFQAF